MSDDEAPISVALLLFGGWCVLVMLIFVISAWFAWGSGTLAQREDRSSAGYFGPSHK